MPRLAKPVERTTIEKKTELVETQPEKTDEVQEFYSTPADPKDQDFFDWIDAHANPEEWKGSSRQAIIYRIEPKFDPRNPDINQYILAYREPFDRERVKADCGGGKFSCWLKENNKLRFRKMFVILAPVRDFLSAKSDNGTAPAAAPAQNQEMFAFMEKMFEKYASAREGGSTPGEALSQAVTILGTAYKSGLENIGKGSQPTSLTDLITAMKTLKEQMQPAENGMMGKFMEKMFERFIDKMEEGGGGSDSRDWKTALANGLSSKVDAILDKGADMLKNYRGAMEAQMALELSKRGYAVTVRPDSQRQTRPAAPVAPAPTNAAEPSQPTQPGQPTAQDIQNATLQVIAFMNSKIIQMMFDGLAGDEVAEWVDRSDKSYADALARVLKTDPKKLLEDPILKKALEFPDLQKFCEDFVSYFEEDKEPAAVPEPA